MGEMMPMMGVLSLFCYHVAKHQSSLLDRAGQAFAIVHRAQPAIVHFLRRASCHERLLCGGLRHDLGFLVSHFWLLSESFDSLFVLFFTFSVSGTRRAELVNRCALFGKPLDGSNRQSYEAVTIRCFTIVRIEAETP